MLWAAIELVFPRRWIAGLANWPGPVLGARAARAPVISAGYLSQLSLESP